jgi:serine/threonine protein phosphatase PrpC
VTDRTKNDEFIIMGCDGIWERFVSDSQGMVDRVIQERRSDKDVNTVLVEMMDWLLAKGTHEELGCDNMTAILIEFNTLV